MSSRSLCILVQVERLKNTMKEKAEVRHFGGTVIGPDFYINLIVFKYILSPARLFFSFFYYCAKFRKRDIVLWMRCHNEKNNKGSIIYSRLSLLNMARTSSHCAGNGVWAS